MVDLVTTGYLTLDDLVLADGRVVRDTLGGGALYAAVGALVWGSAVGLHACAGGDYPVHLLQQIAAAGIDLRGVTDGPPHSLRLWLLEEAERRKQQLPKLASPSVAALDADRGPLPAAYAAAAGFHVAPSLPETQRGIAAEIRRRAPGAVITVDIWTESFFDPTPYSDPSFLADIDAFLPSDKEVEALWGLDDLAATLRRLAAAGPHVVAVKRGGLGSLIYDRGRDVFWEIPAVPVRPIDTIGAGDAYCGGFLTGMVETGDALEAGLRGTISASFAIQDYGALAGIDPDPAEVTRRLTALRGRVRCGDPDS
ncbi:MAG: carbohydrate kinase family protein [Chloroflexota bacterium]|nr:carbohydrate kinase family protein [Chloroflexota bacterium]